MQTQVTLAAAKTVCKLAAACRQHGALSSRSTFWPSRLRVNKNIRCAPERVSAAGSIPRCPDAVPNAVRIFPQEDARAAGASHRVGADNADLFSSPRVGWRRSGARPLARTPRPPPLDARRCAISRSDSRERGSKRVWASSSVCVRSGVLCFAGFGAPIELRAPCVAFGAPCVAFGAPCVAF